MRFSEILPVVMTGGRARRRLWAELGGAVGSWIELVIPAPLPDGRGFAPRIEVWSEQPGSFAPWSAAGRDGLAADWELL